MSLLINEPPKTLKICGEDIPIQYDFRTWIKFTKLFEKEIGPKETAQMFKLIFPVKLPKRFDKAIKAIMDFYSTEKLQKSNKRNKKKSKKVYDFEIDSELIYAAFMQQYKIDLSTVDLHWWKFKALFNSLSEETQFIKVVQYRSMDLSKIKDKDQKKFYREMKSFYRLPDNRTEEEKEEGLNNALSGLF